MSSLQRTRKFLNAGRISGFRYYLLKPLFFLLDVLNATTNWLTVVAVKLLVPLLKRVSVDRSSNFVGGIARRLGPWLPVSGRTREDLKLAFPEKPDAEIENILKGVWENLGRVAGEFVQLEKMWDFDPERRGQGRMMIDEIVSERYLRLHNDGKPAIIFSAHLANWELAAVAAAAHGLDTAVVFRPPNNRGFAELVQETRSGAMSELIRSGKQSIFTMAGVLEKGRHLGILVDQYFGPGVDVTFFGRKTKANPLAARLARNIDCPVHGIRVIRLPENKFKFDLTDEIALPRDADGKIDVNTATQTITTIIEDWIREYPDQWLWLHRRWRDVPPITARFSPASKPASPSAANSPDKA